MTDLTTVFLSFAIGLLTGIFRKEIVIALKQAMKNMNENQKKAKAKKLEEKKV